MSPPSKKAATKKAVREFKGETARPPQASNRAVHDLPMQPEGCCNNWQQQFGRYLEAELLELTELHHQLDWRHDGHVVTPAD